MSHDWEIHTTGNLNKSEKGNPCCENLTSTRTDKGRFLRLLQACNRDRECITESRRKRGQVCNWGHKFARSRHVTLFFLFYCLFFPFPSAAPLFAISVGTVNQRNWKRLWQLGRQVYYFHGNPPSNKTSILAFVTRPGKKKNKHIRRLKFTSLHFTSLHFTSLHFTSLRMSFLLVKRHTFMASEINGNDLEGQRNRMKISVPCLRLSTETILLAG